MEKKSLEQGDLLFDQNGATYLFTSVGDERSEYYVRRRDGTNCFTSYDTPTFKDGLESGQYRYANEEEKKRLNDVLLEARVKLTMDESLMIEMLELIKKYRTK